MTVKETDFQLDTIKAVIAAGGAANKLSNRFLVGISDLLVKFPATPTMLIEVKKNPVPVQSHFVNLDVTPKQLQFLVSYAKVGVRCGVLSFLFAKDRGKRIIHAAVFNVLPTTTSKTFTVSTGSYRLLGHGDEFGRDIVVLLLDDWT